MNGEALRDACDALLLTHREDRLRHDPLSLVRSFPDPRDREVAGLVAASLAFGRVGRILASVRRVLDVLGPRPARLLMEGREDFAADLDGFRHRWVGGADVAALLRGIGGLLREAGTVEAAFAEGLRASNGDLRLALSAFTRRVSGLAGEEARARRGFRFLLPDAMGGGASKRLCLQGPRKNNFGIRGQLHPAQRRCSSVETSKVAPSSRLAGRAHLRSLSCEVIVARPLTSAGWSVPTTDSTWGCGPRCLPRGS